MNRQAVDAAGEHDGVGERGRIIGQATRNSAAVDDRETASDDAHAAQTTEAGDTGGAAGAASSTNCASPSLNNACAGICERSPRRGKQDADATIATVAAIPATGCRRRAADTAHATEAARDGNRIGIGGRPCHDSAVTAGATAATAAPIADARGCAAGAADSPVAPTRAPPGRRGGARCRLSRRHHRRRRPHHLAAPTSPAAPAAPTMPPLTARASATASAVAARRAIATTAAATTAVVNPRSPAVAPVPDHASSSSARAAGSPATAISTISASCECGS